MKGRFMKGVITGSIIGATAGMYAASRMTPRQRKRLMKTGKKMIFTMMDNMGWF